MDIKVILKVSESDPHKEFYVTLSTKSRKEIISNILDEYIEFAEEMEDQIDQIKVYKNEKKNLSKKSYKVPTEKPTKSDLSIFYSHFRDNLPPGYAASNSRLMESNCDGELIFVDNISTYYYHYFLFSQEEWDTKKDLEFIFHEH